MDPAWTHRCVHELPPAVFFGLARILDSCDSVCGTRQFAAHVLDDQMKVRELENSRRGHSMAEEVLWLWAQKNATVQDLLQVLLAIENRRCVEYLRQELMMPPGEYPRRSVPGASPTPGHRSTQASPPMQPISDPGAEKGNPGVLSLPPHPPSHSFCSLDCSKYNVLQPSDSNKYPGHPSASQLPPSISPQANPTEDAKINNLSRQPSSSISVSLHPELDSWLQFLHETVCAGTQNFSEALKLGEGSLGTVYRASICQTDYAAKLLRQNDGCKQETVRKVVESEARNLARLRHPNIIVLAGCSQNDRQCCLIYELAVNGSLSDRLQCVRGTAPLPWLRRLAIAVGLARAVLFMHASQAAPVIHGNIRSSKVLLTESFEPKLGGFGFASLRPSLGLAHDSTVTLTMHTSLMGGQLAFLPDEFLKDGQLSTSLDVYSCGVVLLELLSGIKAYDGSRRPQLLKDLVLFSDPPLLAEQLEDKAAGVWPPRVSSALLALAHRCIGTRKSRPPIREVLEELEVLHKGQFANDQNTFSSSPLEEACAESPQQHRTQHRKPAEMIDIYSGELPRTAGSDAGPYSLRAGGATGATHDVFGCTPLDAGNLQYEDGTESRPQSGACAHASKCGIFQIFPHQGTISSLQLQSLEAPFKSTVDSCGFHVIQANYSRAPVESLDPIIQTDSQAACGESVHPARETGLEKQNDQADGAEKIGGGLRRVEHGASEASEALSRLSLSHTRDTDWDVATADSCATAGKGARERSLGSGDGEDGSCMASQKVTRASAQKHPSNFATENVALQPHASERAGACGSTEASEWQHAVKEVEMNPAKVRMINKIQMYMEGRIDTAELVSLDADQASAEENHSS